MTNVDRALWALTVWLVAQANKANVEATKERLGIYALWLTFAVAWGAVALLVVQVKKLFF